LGTKTSSSTASSVESLKAQLAEITAQIAALTSEASQYGEAVVRRFTALHWRTIQAAMIVDGSCDDKGRITGKLRQDGKGYALVKKADVKLYMACKGFYGTLKAREANGLPIELSATPNDKGRSQVMFAGEIIEQLVKDGWLSKDSALLKAEPKARSTKKS